MLGVLLSCRTSSAETSNQIIHAGLVLSQSRSAPNTRNETDSDPSKGLVQRMRLSSRHKALSGNLFVGFLACLFDKQSSADNAKTPPQFVSVEENGGPMMLLSL